MSEHFQPPARPKVAAKRRQRVHRAAAAAVAGALCAGGLAACGTGDADEAVEELGAAKSEVAIRTGMQQLVDDGFPGVLFSVTDKDGGTRDYVAGVGSRETGERPPKDGYVRIGSNTKSYTAAVVLQLVGEGKVKLDEPVETYLPGVIDGPDYDGGDITVRQLLQHTSGLPEYIEYLDVDVANLGSKHWTPQQMLAAAFKHKAVFPAGTKWMYSNTNYILLGLLIKKITRKPVGEAITERIVERLGLKETYWPKPGDKTIRDPHPEGYTAQPGQKLRKYTEMDPAVAGAAGALIATPSDVNRFFGALMAGDVVPPAQLKEMMKTKKIPEEAGMEGQSYGLGLIETKTPCGSMWGHGGDTPGFETANGVMTDGRSATVAVTALPSAIISKGSKKAMMKEALTKHGHVRDLVETAVCE